MRIPNVGDDLNSILTLSFLGVAIAVVKIGYSNLKPGRKGLKEYSILSKSHAILI